MHFLQTRNCFSASAAAKGVEYCNQLFLLEQKYNGEDEKGNRIAEPLTAEQRYPERQKHSKARVSKKLT